MVPDLLLRITMMGNEPDRLRIIGQLIHLVSLGRRMGHSQGSRKKCIKAHTFLQALP